MSSSIKKQYIYDGYRWGSNRPEIVLIFDADYLRKVGAYPESSWLHLASILECKEKLASSNPISVTLTRVVQLLKAISELFNIPYCLCRIIRNEEQDFGLIIPYYYPKLSLSLVSSLLDYLQNINGEHIDESSEDLDIQLLSTLSNLRKNFDISINNYFILKTANEHPIATTMLDRGVWQLGYGRNSRIFYSSVTDKTPSLSLMWAKDKYRTANFLNRLGYPGAKHILVQDINHLKESLWHFQFPVVIKPRDQEQGVGIRADLRNREDTIDAYIEALKHSKSILLESHQSGFTHRLTVVGGELIKVVKRVAGGVTGDGIHTIRELVDIHTQSEVQQKKIKRRGHALLTLDEEALSLIKQQELTADTILSQGQYIRLRRRDNINAGGTNETISLDSVHPDNVELALNVARDTNFDFLGIDLIIEDITQSWLTIGATICELNGQPQLAAYSDPDIYSRILEKQLVNHGKINIDIFIYSQSKQLDDFYNSCNELHSDYDYITRFDGIYRKTQKITPGFKNSYVSAKSALGRKDIQQLLMCLDCEDILRHGLPIPVHQIHQLMFLSKSPIEPTLLASLGIQQHQIRLL